MIKIDALYLLLLIECVVILAAAAFFFALRSRTSNARALASAQELENLRTAQQDMQKQQKQNQEEQVQVSAPRQAAVSDSAADTTELASCKLSLSVLGEKLKEKTKQVDDLQIKFEDMEKEYLILYNQQQKQQQPNI